MPTPQETFATFVDTLAAALEDGRIDGAELARRMHLSRFHLDRILSAAAGEPPARFRRRILLERAAYRLSVTDDRVLDVAIEAGYGSNEAFDRAFRRAYGRTPSDWRRAPGRTRLDAPSGVHFHPPGGLRLPSQAKVTSVDLVIMMVEHHIHVVGEMIARAAVLDDHRLDAPIEISVEGVDDNPTLRSLLSRLVGQMDMWNCSIASRPYDFEVERGESLESMRRRLSGAGSDFLGGVREIAEAGRFEDTFVDATCEPPEVFTYGGMVAHVLTYAAHRRTLVAGALASAGIDVQDDPMAWRPLEA